jgi:hypothetical protein
VSVESVGALFSGVFVAHGLLKIDTANSNPSRSIQRS